ncbi:pentatricopeptide repeat (PPR) superfamily protein [Tasmannia lanceolata]|uniref:pentatricopeptide repeat (PPR) superfamily protein n=1 Tax=Tasmannia lanceolata TaxID=3420 RepID=UPI004063BF6A
MHIKTLPLSTSKNGLKNLFSPTKFPISYSTTSHKNPNPISYYFSLLHSSPNPTNLRHLHARLLINGLYNNIILSSKLLLMYSKHHKLLPDSLSVFLHMPNKNIYSWNIMIGEFSRAGLAQKSLELFYQMRVFGLGPDVFTLPLILRACASLGEFRLGFSVHGFCVKVGVGKNVFVGSAMVYFYVGMGKFFYARQVFDEMTERDGVLWTAMLAGYAQSGEPLLGLEVFREMVGEGIELDVVVMVSLLLGLGQLGWSRYGRSVHGWCVRRCLGLGLSLGNALVDMYVKCGLFGFARRVFDNMPERDVISWSAMILGHGLNGRVAVALGLFERMRLEGVKPNSVTFLGVLSACSHAGMVEDAWKFFNMMKDYEVVPELKHYACMVDVLGRAGLLVEAERFVKEMPIKPDGAVWGALLGGCRVHGNVVVGERIASRLLRLEPERSGYYVLLANIYAAAGRFDDAEKVWDFMRKRNVGKVPGHSLIELDGNEMFLGSGTG